MLVSVWHLGPLTQKRHKEAARKETSQHEEHPGSITGAARVEQKVAGEQLDKTGIEENASGDRVQNTTDNRGSEASTLVAGGKSQTDGESDGGGEAVSQAKSPGHPVEALGEGDRRQTGADTEALEGLVEDDDRVQGVELLADDAEVQTDDDGVEEDTKFEDQEGRNLLAEDAL